MMKRIFALLLCAATLLTMIAVFASCGQSDDEEYKGQYITTYLTDNIYDLDPAHAYNNEALTNVVGLMFETLFTLDDNGKVKKNLVKDYEITEDDNSGEYKMELELKKTWWSDGTAVSANDIVFAWKRLLEVDADYGAAALLYDIENALEAKRGEVSIDDVGIFPSEEQVLEIRFESEYDAETNKYSCKVDYDQFLYNLTSVALAPLRDDIVSKSDDWAKKSGTMVCSGPFKLGRINWKITEETYIDENAVAITNAAKGEQIDDGKKERKEQIATDFYLERNSYYYRDPEGDQSIMKSVEPYRINVDCSLTSEQLTAAYEAGMIMYIGDIPLDLRSSGTIADAAEVEEYSLSTNSIYFNTNAMIDNGTEEGYALFADAKVRQALSMAIDREALAKAIVYADAATGLIPTGIYETSNSQKTFRETCSATYDALKTDTSKAGALLSEAGINPAKFTIQLTYAAYDEVHALIAEKVAEAWTALGFEVELNKRGTITNNDYYSHTDSVPSDICDDLYAEDLRNGSFEAIILDYVAYSADPYTMLAPFAREFSGRGMSEEMIDTDNPIMTPHITGYSNEEYDALMYEILGTVDIDKRADMYRKAEEMLMEDLPVVPLIFNKKATVTAKNLKKLDSTYYLSADFQNAKISSYDNYLEAGKTFVTDNFADMGFLTATGCLFAPDPRQNGADVETCFTAFKTSNTIYMQFFLDEKEDATEAT